MFSTIKGFKKVDLIYVAEELGESVSSEARISDIKDIIMNCKEYKKDSNFVTELLESIVVERKAKEELEKLRLQQEHELELAKIRAQERAAGESSSVNSDVNNSKRKFTLPKLQFRQFGGEVKEWLPFWSQFENIHNDEEITLEDKFQYLVQATIPGSRARELIDSFPPSGANYSKAIDSLKARFGREDLLVEVYVRELLQLIVSIQSKKKFSLTSLYDKLETYLRALETLDVTTDKCASILFPMVESCFTEEFLKAWNRSANFSAKSDAQERLTNLMNFLKSEVEGAERISLAVAGFGLTKKDDEKFVRKKKYISEITSNRVSTASGLLTTSSVHEIKKLCIFCQGKHSSADCFSARKMSVLEKRKILAEKNCCFACLNPGHSAKKCRVFLKCVLCGRKHVHVMCENLESKKTVPIKEEEKIPSAAENNVNLSNLNKSPKIFLQTLKANIITAEKEQKVRILFDSGSQRSYILKETAAKMKCSITRKETIIHSLFGGLTTKEVQHSCHRVNLSDLNKEFRCNFEALDQDTICETVPPVRKGPWLDELKRQNIHLTDVGDSNESIHILIGADIMGKLLTGKLKVLSSGLVAVQTLLGWTLMGKLPQESFGQENIAVTVTNLFVKESEMADLWKLDLIGIKDPIEKLSQAEQDQQTKEHFLETVQFKDGRYEVQLPWIENSCELHDNLALAQRRLKSTTVKLKVKNQFQSYEQIFLDWLKEGIIEEVPMNEITEVGHYLPHRPVIKESDTTPIRPVFDASARTNQHPSLNQLLQCGPNLIELIPDILLRFRVGKFGVTADIKKAFLQISICKKDRNFLRFLWWENLEEKKFKIFRHSRVVFGVKCSPFLLEAVLEYHIMKNNTYDPEFKMKLLKSFYVDNVVTSVNDEKELYEFMSSSNDLMAEGGFELRGWEDSSEVHQCQAPTETSILGMTWNRHLDLIKVNMKWLKNFKLETITKRVMLSVAHRVFDPLGYTAPVMLCPKLLLQKTWQMGLGWDQEVDSDIQKQFLSWYQELNFLEEIAIPRWIKVTPKNLENCSIHTFCDASKEAYAAVVFLRIEDKSKVEVSFLAAKARVAPLKACTIPRMELLAALVGARLTESIISALGWNKIERFYWSDSTTVIAWITRPEKWTVFVRNRIHEIQKLTDPSNWHHVPGEMNPADLPTRGCKAKQLISLKWWEGPSWLKETPNNWHFKSDLPETNFYEQEIVKEKSNALLNSEECDPKWYYRYFSKYLNIVRLIAWIFRFKKNCATRKEHRISGELTSIEIEAAQKKIIKLIQQEFTNDIKKDLNNLSVYEDENGILRVKTRIIYRQDEEEFRKPALLPSKHEVVHKLIQFYHEKNSHCGTQILLNLLRENFWILRGRKTVRKVISSCVTCKRFTAKNLETTPAPLPENRICNAAVFQIVGIDAAGPLVLRGNKKAWILLFTCAIYRAVHLELVTSLSTEDFIFALRRFIARRGRCQIIYCDNGTNFVGAANQLKSLNWDKIQKFSTVHALEWKFNPPTAAWWGGWWERLIRLMKDVLKRVLGKALLSVKEIVTVLCDCEAVINSRPLTYSSESESDLEPLCPAMFLQDLKGSEVPDLDESDHTSLNRKLRHRHLIQEHLRKRFRSEYLGALVQRTRRKPNVNSISVGDVVLIGYDNSKRINWPLGRITELLPGRDGTVRLVRIKTSHNTLLRPIQRVYPLEIPNPDCLPSTMLKKAKMNKLCAASESPNRSSKDNTEKLTRSGRKINQPQRLIY